MTGVFFDTTVICTVTGLCICASGVLGTADASGAPVYAEIAENDKIIAAAEFTNFIFGDILSPDAAQ